MVLVCPRQAPALPSASPDLARPSHPSPLRQPLVFPAKRTGVTAKLGERGAPKGALPGTSCLISGMAVAQKRWKSQFDTATNCRNDKVTKIGVNVIDLPCILTYSSATAVYGWWCTGPAGQLFCPLVLQRTTIIAKTTTEECGLSHQPSRRVEQSSIFKHRYAARV